MIQIIENPKHLNVIKCKRCGCKFSYTEEDVIENTQSSSLPGGNSFHGYESMEWVEGMIKWSKNAGILPKEIEKELKKYPHYLCYSIYDADVVKCPCCHQPQIKELGFTHISVNPEGKCEAKDIIYIL